MKPSKVVLAVPPVQVKILHDHVMIVRIFSSLAKESMELKRSVVQVDAERCAEGIARNSPKIVKHGKGN